MDELNPDKSKHIHEHRLNQKLDKIFILFNIKEQHIPSITS